MMIIRVKNIRAYFFKLFFFISIPNLKTSGKFAINIIDAEPFSVLSEPLSVPSEPFSVLSEPFSVLSEPFSVYSKTPPALRTGGFFLNNSSHGATERNKFFSSSAAPCEPLPAYDVRREDGQWVLIDFNRRTPCAAVPGEGCRPRGRGLEAVNITPGGLRTSMQVAKGYAGEGVT
jgi:hypothetical protein